MIENIGEKIDNFLKKNHLVALFPFVANKKTVFRKDFVISWTHNYTTLVKRDNTEYFLKVALEKEKFADLERQVHFYQLLETQKQLTFNTPHLYEWNTSGDFYFYLREKMNGVLLGNCVRAKAEFATKHIFNQLKKGYEEIAAIPTTDNHWIKTKDNKWIKHKIKRTDENETLKNAIGRDLWKRTKHRLQSYQSSNIYDLKSMPLWGDPGPNNFLVEHGRLAIIDYAPFSYGYQFADFAEFASFCIFSPEWRQFLSLIKTEVTKNTDETKLFNAFFSIFLIDRIASVLWLESRGQLKLQLRKPKEFYINTAKEKLIGIINYN